MNENHVIKISAGLSISDWQVRNTIQLLNDGATIPFISRYRKEATGSLDEVQIAAIKICWLSFRKSTAGEKLF